MKSPVRVGTAGWGVPSRYLADIPAGGSHLERYARVFSAVEIDDPLSSDEADARLASSGVARVATDPPRWQGNELPGGDRRLAYFRWHGAPRLYYSEYTAQRMDTLADQLAEAARVSRAVWCASNVFEARP
jgi:uncharacterized protein YecE (DUF72 family)